MSAGPADGSTDESAGRSGEGHAEGVAHDDGERVPSGAGEQSARLLLVAAPFLLASVVILLLRLIG